MSKNIKNYNKQNWSNKHGRWENNVWIRHPKKEEPEDKQSLEEINISLYDGVTIQEMVDKCLPHADDCEFQIHYHSLQVHLTKDDSKIILTIPLAYYNFDQSVSAGSVEMEMKDVNEISDKAKELTNDKMTELFEAMPVLQHFGALGFEAAYTMSDNGSIHRHPGDFSFSSIDYDKAPEEPGVIYRQANAKDLYQTDSVLYLGHTGKAIPKFVCTETRIVNVELVEENGGIKGTYTEIPTMSFILQPKVKFPNVLKILGEEEQEVAILKRFKTTSRLIALKEYPLLVEVLKAFEESNFKPDHENVDGDRIDQGFVYISKTVTTSDKKKEGTTTTAKVTEFYTGDDEYYNQWAEDWENEYYKVYQTPSEINSSKIEKTVEEEDLFIVSINGEAHYFDDLAYMYLPIKCNNMSREEIASYIALEDQKKEDQLLEESER